MLSYLPQIDYHVKTVIKLTSLQLVITSYVKMETFKLDQEQKALLRYVTEVYIGVVCVLMSIFGDHHKQQ